MNIPQQQRMTRLIVISVVSCIPWFETEDWSYRIAKRLPSSWLHVFLELMEKTKPKKTPSVGPGLAEDLAYLTVKLQ